MNTKIITALISLLCCCLALHAAAPRPHPEVPLPDGVEGQAGLRFVDINGDGQDDIVFSNSERYGVYLFNDKEHKGLGWAIGWSGIASTIREGRAGDANALPLTTVADVVFKDGAMWVKGVKAMTFADLCRPPMPSARMPEQSLKAMHVKAGFTAEIAAREPLVQDPIFVDWDARGRMWVVEMADYPFHEDKGQTHHGRVKILEDTNGDGIYDKATVFLDDLTYPTGLACWKNGVFIASVPEVFFVEENNGKAGQRTPVLTGFNQGNPQHLVNGFAWGLDGWLYGGNGDSGGKITEVKSGREFDLSGRDFRFNPATGEFQLQPGKAQYGRWRDDFGNWFANNNSNLGWHYFLDDRYLARNPQLAVRTLTQNLNPGGNRLYPVGTPLPRLNSFGGESMLTSGCSLLPYRDTLFGDAYKGSVFICEPAQSLVHREVLEADGISFTSHRADDEKESEFLASEDKWSRFTQARTGPDGALYVVDMYRMVIEHPQWIPKPMIEALDLRAGSEMGRIYRISPANVKRRAIPNLAAMKDDELGKMLESVNGWTRDTAQRLLIERGAKWSSDTLAGSLAAQVQQLWTMHTLGTLKPVLLQNAMRDKNAGLREHAVRIAEKSIADAAMLKAISDLANDDDVRVRVQVAFSLGECKDASVAATLSALAKRDAATPGMLAALLSSSPNHAEAKQWQAMLKGEQKAANTPPPPKIITNISADRDKVVRAYASVATLTGDPARGHALYTTACSACHRLKNEGSEIGPDLGTIAGKPTEQLIEAILDPSRAVEQRYLAHTITLKSGGQITGIIAEETANSITLKLGGATEVILRASIAKDEAGTKSLMPDGLESILNPQAVADVLAWIRAK